MLGHRESPEECLHYWKTTKVPFKERMAGMIGMIVKLKDPTPVLYDQTNDQFDAPPGTYVRLTDYTPDTPGMKAGNYWSIETLDGKYSAGQIYQDEFEVLTLLDRLALIEDEALSPGDVVQDRPGPQPPGR